MLYEHIPERFLQGDLTVDDKRHLVFATDRQIEILGKSTVWFVDGTFDVVNEPYKQLYSIHAFVKSGDSIKQLPLVFMLMSRRQASDYESIFKLLSARVTEICGAGKYSFYSLE